MVTTTRQIELGAAAGGIDYSSVSVAISRLEKKLPQDARLRRRLREIEAQLAE